MANAGLLKELLEEGQDLSAVDVFSRWHDSQPNVSHADRFRHLIPHTPMEGQQYAFEVDLDACSGCKACVIACHHRNGLEEDETWRRVGQLQSQGRASYPSDDHCGMSSLCRTRMYARLSRPSLRQRGGNGYCSTSR